MRIKKFNEDTSDSKLTLAFIKECFINFFDNDIYSSEVLDNVPNEEYFTIGFDIPIVKIGDYIKVEDLVKVGSDLNEFFSDIHASIEKVKIEFPNIFIEIYHETYGPNNRIESVRNKQYVTITLSKEDIVN